VGPTVDVVWRSTPARPPIAAPGRRSNNRRELVIVYAGDQRLYQALWRDPVSPQRHPHVRGAALWFIDWLTLTEERGAIAAYRVGVSNCSSRGWRSRPLGVA
jgi:hypothetical protein